MDIKPTFDIANYKGKYVMHCDTVEKANCFLKYLNKLGLRWRSDVSYMKRNHWLTYGTQTCYSFNKGEFGSMKSYENKCYCILEFDDFQWNYTTCYTKSALPNGVVVETRCGNRYLHINQKLLSNNNCVLLDGWDEDLKWHNEDANVWDIVKIYDFLYAESIDNIFYDNSLVLIWEREDDKDENLFHGQTLEYWHRELWNWLADNPDKKKSDWVKLQNFTEEERKELVGDGSCFACMYSTRIIDNDGCRDCPICDIKRGYSCLNGLFMEWETSEGFKRAQVAHEIANLEWKEK